MEKLDSWNYSWLITLLLIVSVGLSLFAHLQQHKLSILQKQRHESYLVAQELRLSSDQLTLMARAYAATGNPRFYQYFRDILAIRNGQKARPKHYNRAYWDMLMPRYGKPPYQDGETKPLVNKMRELHFTRQEFSMLQKAERKSNILVLIEEQAFRVIAEQRANKEPFPSAKAVELLYSPAYLNAKRDIMYHINQFLELEEQRSQQLIEGQKRQYLIAIIAQYIAYLALALVTFSYFRYHQGMMLRPASA